MTGYTPTPDFYNDYIAHYGVKGMKWGKRKKKSKEDLKSDLKWKASKVKNKALELEGRLKTTKHQRTATQWGSENDRGYSRSEGRIGTMSYIYEPGKETERKKHYVNNSNLEAGIEAGRERVAAEKKKKKK